MIPWRQNCPFVVFLRWNDKKSNSPFCWCFMATRVVYVKEKFKNQDNRSMNDVNLRISSHRRTWDNCKTVHFPAFFFTRSGNFKSLYWKVTAQTNKRALSFSKIQTFCVWSDKNFFFPSFRAQKGNNARLELPVRKAKTSTVTLSFCCSFTMSYIWYSITPIGFGKIWIVYLFRGN